MNPRWVRIDLKTFKRLTPHNFRTFSINFNSLPNHHILSANEWNENHPKISLHFVQSMSSAVTLGECLPEATTIQLATMHFVVNDKQLLCTHTDTQPHQYRHRCSRNNKIESTTKIIFPFSICFRWFVSAFFSIFLNGFFIVFRLSSSTIQRSISWTAHAMYELRHTEESFFT